MNTSKKSNNYAWLSLCAYLVMLCFTQGICAMDYNWEQPFRKTLTLEGHEAEILIIQTSPDESFVLTADVNGVAKIWDTNLGVCLHTLEPKNKTAIICIAISHDNTTIALEHCDNTIDIWCTKTDHYVNTIKNSSRYMPSNIRLKNLLFNNILHECLIVVTRDQSITCYDIHTGDVLNVFDGGMRQDAYSFDITFRNNTVLLSDTTVNLYDFTSKKPLLKTFQKPHENTYALCALGNNKLALYSNFIIDVWDIITEKKLVTFPIIPKKDVSHMAFNTNDTTLTTIKNKRIQVWDVDHKKIRYEVEHHKPISFCRLSSDDKYALVSSRGMDAKYYLYDMSTKSMVRTLDCGPVFPSKSSSGKFLISEKDCQARIFFFHKKLFHSNKQSMLGNSMNKSNDIHSFADTCINFE